MSSVNTMPAAFIPQDDLGNVTLATLPAELLAHIVTHIETAGSLSQLSQTCRRVHTFIQQDAFRIFVQTRFPYFEPPTVHSPTFWKDVAHGLTTFSRNWDRKAFVAWSIHPQPEENRDYRRQRAYFRSGQTMGFVPTIDSYEAWYGGDWSSRKEVVAWSAGAGLVMRIKTMGGKAQDLLEATTKKSLTEFNIHKHRITWKKYHKVGAVEGRDDITSVNMIPQSTLEAPERVVVGRASGCLSLISVAPYAAQDEIKVLTTFETNNRAVRSAATSTGSGCLLAACLSDSSIALYPPDTAHSHVGPLGEAVALPTGVRGRTWSCRFLSHDRLAVGFGPSKEPILVYNLGRGELRQEDVRSLSILDLAADSRLDTPETNSSSATSIYSLAPIPKYSVTGGAPGEVFLSGAYDGLIRLHDLRTPHTASAVFRDPVDTFSPIYSLLPVGSERFVAGGGRHSIIKVFDIRMPGGKLYHSANVKPCSTERHSPLEQKDPSGHYTDHYGARFKRRGWNVFLRVQSNRSWHNSPVYSLSRPSHSASSLFAGIEGQIVQLDMVSIMDQHPDPVFPKGPTGRGDWVNVRQKWDPLGEAIPLPMYEQTTGPVKLVKQRANLEYSELPIKEGWDERWMVDSHR